MIQRVQSIFLLLMAVIMFTFLFLPIWVKTEPTTKDVVTIMPNQVTHFHADALPPNTEVLSQHWHLTGLATLSGLLALLSIFQYRNRLRQIQLGTLNALLILGVVVASVLVINAYDKVLDQQVPGNYAFGFFMPVIALMFNSLANRFIRRDERLVRASDRVR